MFVIVVVVVVSYFNYVFLTALYTHTTCYSIHYCSLRINILLLLFHILRVAKLFNHCMHFSPCYCHANKTERKSAATFPLYSPRFIVLISLKPFN